MTPLPACLVSGSRPPHPPLVAWRIDQKKYQASWDSGEGARLAGGRWNSAGRRIVYCALDPATAILEVAVHKGFKTLDAVPHILTSLRIDDPDDVHVVPPDAIPAKAWLQPGIPNIEQQGFGDAMLLQHSFAVIPSVVSRRSWNLVFDSARAQGRYRLASQEEFVLDPRLQAGTRR